MRIDEPPVIVTQIFNCDSATVWAAITEPDQMRKWFFENIPDFKPKAGFETQFVVDTGERKFNHLWKLVEVIPNKKLKFNWRYESYIGNSFVTFELTDGKNTTTLKITVEITEDFSDDIPEFTWESCRSGWQYFINKRLQNYLAK